MTLGARKDIILQKPKDDGGTEEARLLFTNRALGDAEAMLGKSMFQVLPGFVTGKSGIRDIAIIVKAGLDAARRDERRGGSVTIDDAYNLMDAVGVQKVANAISEGINAVMNYGEETAEPDPNA